MSMKRRIAWIVAVLLVGVALTAVSLVHKSKAPLLPERHVMALCEPFSIDSYDAWWNTLRVSTEGFPLPVRSIQPIWPSNEFNSAANNGYSCDPHTTYYLKNMAVDLLFWSGLAGIIIAVIRVVSGRFVRQRAAT